MCGNKLPVSSNTSLKQTLFLLVFVWWLVLYLFSSSIETDNKASTERHRTKIITEMYVLEEEQKALRDVKWSCCHLTNCPVHHHWIVFVALLCVKQNMSMVFRKQKASAKNNRVYHPTTGIKWFSYEECQFHGDITLRVACIHVHHIWGNEGHLANKIF